MDQLRVGVVGCGMIAQIMHLPYLSELPEFRLTALCDLSRTVVEAMGERFGVAARYTDYEDLWLSPPPAPASMCWWRSRWRPAPLRPTP